MPEYQKKYLACGLTTCDCKKCKFNVLGKCTSQDPDLQNESCLTCSASTFSVKCECFESETQIDRKVALLLIQQLDKNGENLKSDVITAKQIAGIKCHRS